MPLTVECAKRSSILPLLMDQVFKKFTRESSGSLTKRERRLLFVELNALLNKSLLERALRLLDEWIFVVYYSQNRLNSIVELSSKRKKLDVVRVIPDINYCKCGFFQRSVLQLTGENSDRCDPEITCEHVLAVRLHHVLNRQCSKQVLSSDDFMAYLCDVFEDQAET
ncbi:uncharacterized protein LOC115624378 [Scaptodrosophila lebanonensis]|uniref:Uncharacterized protein LOC115624378 n=1 Tax=Drosophila lebanonensis TaxID=7225 RepID=A0A6J2TDT9_DROLE|nr:uncharacterized protein LOC115624378 [Scaptodrosophila lebanonensis]